MTERRSLLKDGQPMPDGYFLNKWFESRFNKNKNVLILIIGATGSGKSWACMKICEDWYKYRFGETKKFTSNNICFSLVESAEKILNGEVKQEEFLIVEEAGIQMNSLEFQNKTNKLFNNILQSVRCKNTGFIFNLPSFALMNKTARSLAHAVFEMVKIEGNYSVLKPKGLQTNAMSGKIYPKYLRQIIDGKFIKASRLKVGKPSPELVIPYEKMKQEFVDKQLRNIVDEHKPKDKKRIEEEHVPNSWKAIKLLHEKGIENQNEIAKVLGISQPKVNVHIKNMEKKGYFLRNFLEKAVLYTNSPKTPILST